MRIKVKGLIVIHIDTLRREYPYHYILKKGFEKLGYKVILVSRRNIKFLLMVIAPEVLIVSHSFILPNDYLNNLRRKTDIYIIAVETVGDESLLYPTDFPEDIDLDCFKGIFIWNYHYKRWLIDQRKVSSDKVYAFGSPRVSMCKYAEQTKNNTIGFIGRFEFINDFAQRPPLATLLNFKKERRHFVYRWFAEIEGSIIFNDIIAYLIESGHKVSIRPHPQERVATYNALKDKYKDKIDIDNSVDFIGWLERIDIIVATLSTALTEAYLFKKPIISIDKMFRENYMIHYDKWIESYTSIAYLPGTMEEAKDIFKEELDGKRDSNKMNAFLKRYYNVEGDQGFDGLENIIRVIHKDRPKGCKANIIKCYLTLSFYLFLDVLLLLRNISRGSFYLDRTYNYCPFIHRPTQFMKRAATKFSVDLGKIKF